MLYIFSKIPDEVESYVQSGSSDSSTYRYNVEIMNHFDPELQHINTKPMIKNKLKELLIKLKKFEVQTVLDLDYKNRSNCKIFHSSAYQLLAIRKLMKHLNRCIKAL